MIIAVGAEREALALVAGGPRQQLEVVERTLELAIDAHRPVLRQAVRVVAVRAVQAGWLRL